MGDRDRAAGLGSRDAGELPAVAEVTATEGQIVDEAAGPNVGRISRGDVFFESLVEAISGLEVGDGASKNGGIEDGPGIVN